MKLFKVNFKLLSIFCFVLGWNIAAEGADLISIPVPCVNHLMCWIYCSTLEPDGTTAVTSDTAGCCFAEKSNNKVGGSWGTELSSNRTAETKDSNGILKFCYCCEIINVGNLLSPLTGPPEIAMTVNDQYCDTLQQAMEVETCIQDVCEKRVLKLGLGFVPCLPQE